MIITYYENFLLNSLLETAEFRKRRHLKMRFKEDL